MNSRLSSLFRQSPFFWRSSLLCLLCGFALFAGCSGGGSSGDGTVDPYKTLSASVVLEEPVEGMSVQNVIGQSSYIDSDESDSNGRFTFRADPAHFLPNQYYLVELACLPRSSCRETHPTLTNLHAVLTREQMQAGGWEVNALTEVLYQAGLYYVQSNYPFGRINAYFDDIARHLLNQDLSDDGVIDRNDLLVWRAGSDRGALRSAQMLDRYIATLEAGRNRVMDTQALLGPITGYWKVLDGASENVVENVRINGDAALVAWRSGVQRLDLSNSAQLLLRDAYTNFSEVYFDSWMGGDAVYLFSDRPRLDLLSANGSPDLVPTALLGSSFKPSYLIDFNENQTFAYDPQAGATSSLIGYQLGVGGLAQQAEYLNSEKLSLIKVSGDRVYAVSDDTFYARQQATGTLDWDSVVPLNKTSVSSATYLAIEDGPAGKAWLASADGELYTLDVTDPATVYIAGQLQTGARIASASVANQVLSLLTLDQGILRFDVSGDGLPKTLSAIRNHALEYRAFSAFTAYGDQLLLAGSDNALQRIDLNGFSTLNNPVLGSLQAVDGPAYGGVFSDRNLYLAAGDKGVQVIDVSNYASPSISGTLLTGIPATGLAAYQNLLVVFDGTELEIWDRASRFDESPQEEAAFSYTSRVADVAIVDHFAYVLTEFDGVRVVDLNRDPATNKRGRVVATINLSATQRFTHILIHQDGRAYLSSVYAATGKSAPAAMISLASVSLSGFAPYFDGPLLDILPVNNDGGYGISLASTGLKIYPYLHRPTATLVESGRKAFDTGIVNGIKLIGKTLYVLGNAGLRVVNVSNVDINNPNEPPLISTIATPSPPAEVIEGDSFLYVLTVDGRILIHAKP